MFLSVLININCISVFDMLEYFELFKISYTENKFLFQHLFKE